MSYNVPIAVLVGLVVLLSFGATAAAAETDTRVGVCVVGDSPCNDPGDTPTADRPVDDDTPIQFHPDELPYASGLADGDESGEVAGECIGTADDHCVDDEFRPPGEIEVTGVDDVETLTPTSRFEQLWAVVRQLF